MRGSSASRSLMAPTYQGGKDEEEEATGPGEISHVSVSGRPWKAKSRSEGLRPALSHCRQQRGSSSPAAGSDAGPSSLLSSGCSLKQTPPKAPWGAETLTVAYIDQQEAQHKPVTNSYACERVRSASPSQTSSAAMASSGLTCVCAALAFCTRFKRSVGT